MKISIPFVSFVLFLLKFCPVSGQEIKFNKVYSNNNYSWITAMVQDQQGFIWFATEYTGLQRYDGAEYKFFAHDPKDSNSLADNYVQCLFVDSLNIIWIGTNSAGLDRFDPESKVFKHFRHDPNDSSSLISNKVMAVLEDHLGNLWVGTDGGLDLLDKKTDKFKHYANRVDDPTSLSFNGVRTIYEDKAGTLWVGCGRSFAEPVEKVCGGLNRFDRTTGNFTRYLHDPNDPASIASNSKVKSILEDSKGNFWVGTAGDGLHTMDRGKGTFTHYYYDANHPEKLSRPAFLKENIADQITFIKEDITGAIWIGSHSAGLNRYDPETKKTVHYGPVLQDIQDKLIFSYKDTSVMSTVI